MAQKFPNTSFSKEFFRKRNFHLFKNVTKINSSVKSYRNYDSPKDNLLSSQKCSAENPLTSPKFSAMEQNTFGIATPKGSNLSISNPVIENRQIKTQNGIRNPRLDQIQSSPGFVVEQDQNTVGSDQVLCTQSTKRNYTNTERLLKISLQ